MAHCCILDPGVKNNVPSQVHLKDPRSLNIGTFGYIHIIFLAIFAALYNVADVLNIDGRVLPISSHV